MIEYILSPNTRKNDPFSTVKAKQGKLKYDYPAHMGESFQD